MIRADEDFDLSIGGDDFSFISANGNILHDELDIEKRLKSLKYDWVADSATKALFKVYKKLKKREFLQLSFLVIAMINDLETENKNIFNLLYLK